MLHPTQNPAEAVHVRGIPDAVPERIAAVARTRLLAAYRDVSPYAQGGQPVIEVGPARAAVQFPVPPSAPAAANGRSGEDEVSLATRAATYVAEPPRFTFDQLVLPPALIEDLMTAVEAMRLRQKIFAEWGLRAIEPAPSAAINLHGPPGTGKTLAAHAIAARLGVPLVMAGYAELESKFHGDGPKNVKAAFLAAERQNALLFIDEADSLLSRRLTNVSQGSEQAINSMRSQIVLCLDGFTGIVVFSTNLVSNYDSAFESRVRHFHFPMPDLAVRTRIWDRMLVPQLPRAAEVTITELAAMTDGFSGRELKLATIEAAERAALAGRDAVSMADFAAAIRRAEVSRRQVRAAHEATEAGPPALTPAPAASRLTPEQQQAIRDQLSGAPAE